MQELSENTDSPRTAGCHGHNKQPISHFCVTCGLSICRNCTNVDHTAKNGHVVISVSKTEASYLQELNVSHTSLNQNKENLQLIESEMTLLTAAKEMAIKDMESYIKLAYEQLEQRKDDLMNDILDRFIAKLDTLLNKQKVIQEAAETIKSNIIRAKTITKTGHLYMLKSISETLKKFNEKTQSVPLNLDLGENYLAFDSTKGLNEFKKCLSDFGQAYSKGFLPSAVTLGSTDATAGHKTTHTVEICNHHGDKLPISSDSFSVQVTDPTGNEVEIVPCTSGPECTVTFTPQISGLHEVSARFLGQQLTSEQTHIAVSSNNPVLRFGEKGNGNGAVLYPWGIAIDNNDCLYVADVGNKLIQKFTVDGEFIGQFSVAVNYKDHTTCDIALDLNNGLIFCTEILLRNNNLEKGQNLLVFDLEGELQHTYPLSDAMNPLCIAINIRGEIIVSDVQKQCLMKISRVGKFLGRTEHFNHPCFIAVDDNNLIVPDRKDDCVYVCSSDGAVRRKFGVSGTGKGQLNQPRGVAACGGDILVADSGNKRVQVFKNDGTFVSMIESIADPLADPRGLAVTEDGYVYVVDTDNHCIKKYKYKDMP